MKRCFFVSLAFLTLSFALSGCKAENNTILRPQEGQKLQNITSNQWQKVDSGLDYKDIDIFDTSDGKKPSSLNFFLVRALPEKFVFQIYQNKNAEKTIQEIHKATGSVLTVNGSFFDENFRTIGLLISEGKKLHHFSKAKLLNGIFALDKNNKARLYHPAHDISEKDFSFAIQNGPVLIDQNGNIKIGYKNNQKASRTAIGLDKNENVIIIAVKQSLFNSENAVSLSQFARLLQQAPELKTLGLHSVLNLDGGASTGIMIDNHYLPELNTVSNVITVFKKHANIKQTYFRYQRP